MYCPYRIALYLHVGRYGIKAVSSYTLLYSQLHRLLGLHVRTSDIVVIIRCGWARRGELIQLWVAAAPHQFVPTGKKGLPAIVKEVPCAHVTHHDLLILLLLSMSLSCHLQIATYRSTAC